jgi:hypothetical protein
MRTIYLGRIVAVTLALLASVVASAALSGPGAEADTKVALGGGAGIALEDTLCTLATIGHDNTGELVGFTAAHCGGPGTQVRVNGADNIVGSVVAANSDLDYAVIKFDPAKVAPIANADGFAINGIGPNPDPFQKACWLGAVTGNVCSHFNAYALPFVPRRNLADEARPGDDGGPVTSNDLLIGMIVEGYEQPSGAWGGSFPATLMLLFSALLTDLNATGGPGAGFTPALARS